MSLTIKDIEHIANLARLELSDEEKKRYKKQLSSILGHIEKLKALDTENVQAMNAVITDRSRLRKDVPGDCLSQEELLSNAPATEENQFKVPPVLDEDSS